MITEAQFEVQVKHLANLYGWYYSHPWISVHSVAGYPDCTMTRDGRIIWAELKSEKGELSPEQYFWLLELMKVKGAEVYLWEPDDIEDIALILR